jgi:hypothetical protein
MTTVALRGAAPVASKTLAPTMAIGAAGRSAAWAACSAKTDAETAAAARQVQPRFVFAIALCSLIRPTRPGAAS